MSRERQNSPCYNERNCSEKRECILEQRKIGYAVVGLGIGRSHADAAANSKHGKLVAVCDLLQDRLQAAVEKHPGILTCESFDEMLKNPDVEICQHRSAQRHARGLCCSGYGSGQACFSRKTA
ncbi:MAG: Gfo/Idh/MocA family oxidoreductase [Clostridia bacterium]